MPKVTFCILFLSKAPSEYENEYSTLTHDDGLETSSQGLRFIINEKHFQEGNMKLRCTATISKGYVMSIYATIRDKQQASPLLITLDKG